MIDNKTIIRFIDKASRTLSGEWIIIGGTVLPILGVDYRITIDIDFININFHATNSETIKLMEIAEELKLPVESINQAGAFYLSKIKDFQSHLVLIKENKRCKIYRPDLYLFIKLKIERFTETDLNDCLMFITHNYPELKDHQKLIQKLIEEKIKKTKNEQILERLEKIKTALSSTPREQSQKN